MRTLFLSSLLILSACGGSPACESGEPTLVLGIASDNGLVFTPLADGDTLHLEHGPQGGAHLPLAIATTGVAPRDELWLVLDGEVPSEWVQSLELEQADFGEAYGVRVRCMVQDDEARDWGFNLVLPDGLVWSEAITQGGSVPITVRAHLQWERPGSSGAEPLSPVQVELLVEGEVP